MAVSRSIALVAGGGDLPSVLARALREDGWTVLVVDFGQNELDWIEDFEQFSASFEKPGKVFKELKARGIQNVSFAGAMRRPTLNPLKFDKVFLSVASRLLPALKGGDDKALRIVNEIFEKEGLTIVPPQDILSELVVSAGILTQTKPSEEDMLDIQRAQDIARKMGEADTGQAVVVAQGLALGIETISGTDAMLKTARESSDYKPNPDGAKGVLFKGPKSGQDLRIDLPTIGLMTLQNVADAGLAGIAVEADGVLILNKDEAIEFANQNGLFIIAVPAL